MYIPEGMSGNCFTAIGLRARPALVSPFPYGAIYHVFAKNKVWITESFFFKDNCNSCLLVHHDTMTRSVRKAFPVVSMPPKNNMKITNLQYMQLPNTHALDFPWNHLRFMQLRFRWLTDNEFQARGSAAHRNFTFNENFDYLFEVFQSPGASGMNQYLALRPLIQGRRSKYYTNRYCFNFRALPSKYFRMQRACR